MPSKPVFLGARLASLPMRSQERSISSEDGMDCVLQEFDDDTGFALLLSVLHGLCLRILLLSLSSVHFCCLMSCRSDPGVDFVTGAAHCSRVKLPSTAPASNAGAALHFAQRSHRSAR